MNDHITKMDRAKQIGYNGNEDHAHWNSLDAKNLSNFVGSGCVSTDIVDSWERVSSTSELLSNNHLYWPDLDIDLAVESIEHSKRLPLEAD